MSRQRVFRWVGLMGCVAFLVGCPPDDTATRGVSLDLSGVVELEGAGDLPPEQRSALNVQVRLAFDDGGLVGLTQAGSDGRFVFSNVPERNMRLDVTAAGYEPVSGLAVFYQGGDFSLEGEAPVVVSLRLDRRAQLRIQLTSEEPPDDWTQAASGGVELSGDFSAQTSIDSGGVLTLVDGVPPGRYIFTANVPGYLPLVQALELKAGLNELSVELRPESRTDQAASLRGRVDTGGEERGGVQVRVVLDNGQLYRMLVTDQEGWFAVEAGRREHTLFIFKEGFQRAAGHPEQIDVEWSEELETFVVQADGRPLDEVVWSLEPDLSAQLTAQLTSDAQPPIANWQAAFVPAASSLSRVDGQPSDALLEVEPGGLLSLQSPVQPGLYILDLVVAGHLPLSDVVLLGSGSNALGELELVPELNTEEAPVMRGVVDLEGRDDDSGVQVTALIEGQLFTTAITNAAGEFAFQTSRRPHRLTFSREGYVAPPDPIEVIWRDDIEGQEAGFVRQATLERLDASPVVLEALPSATLVGRIRAVVDGGGEVIALEDWSSRGFVTLVGEDAELDRIAPIVDAPGGRGQFQFAGVPPGRYELAVAVQGFSPYSSALQLGEGTTELPEVEVVLLGDEGSDGTEWMRGRVSLEGQVEAGGVLVEARLRGALVATSLTDRGGSFALPLSRTDYSLDFSRDGFSSLRDVAVRWDEGDARFEFQGEALEEVAGLELGRLTGQISVSAVIEPAWIPPAQRQITVRLVGNGEDRSAELTGAPFVFTDVPVGDYIVFVQRPGFTSVQRSVRLEVGALEQSLELPVSLLELADAGLVLSGLTLTSDNLREVPDLKEANLSGVTIVGEQGGAAQLCGLDLEEANLVGAVLEGADLRGANLSGARLDNALLTDALMSGVTARGASFFGANLEGGDFTVLFDDLSCEGGELSVQRTDLTNANVSSANLTNTRFAPDEAGLEGDPCEPAASLRPLLDNVRWNQADLTGAHMPGADLGGAILTNTLMVDTDLSGACLADAVLTGVALIRTSLEHVNGAGVSLSGVVTEGTRLRGARLDGARMVGALFSNVELSEASLVGADLRSSEWIDVTLVGGVDFSGADLRNAVLSQEDARGVVLVGAQLTNAVLAGTNLEGANLEGANLLGVDLTLAIYSRDTRWPSGFEHRTVDALGPETELVGFVFPDGHPARNVDLSRANLQGARWLNADLSEANLSGVNLLQANISGADMSDANLDLLRAFELVGTCPALLPPGWICDVQPSSGRRVLVGPGADLVGANLVGLDLSEADLTGTRLYGLPGCPPLPDGFLCAGTEDGEFVLFGPGLDYSGADLSGGGGFFIPTNRTFDGADLVETNLVGSSLQGVDLSDSELTGVRAFNLVGECPAALPEGWECVLQPSNGLVAVVGPTANLSGADLSEADLSGLDLSEALLVGSDLSDANLTAANLAAADLTDSTLIGAQLSEANLLDPVVANVRAYELQGACPEPLKDRWECRTHASSGLAFLVGPGVNMTGSDLSNTDLSNLTLDGATLSGSALAGANLSGASLAATRTYGVLGGCPASLPERWSCVEAQATFILLGPGSDLNGLDLSNAALTELDLEGAQITGTDFSNTDLRGTNLSDVMAVRSNFTGALMDGVQLADSHLNEAILAEATVASLAGPCPASLPPGWSCVELPAEGRVALYGPGGVGLNQWGVDFSGADLSDLDLEGQCTEGILGCPAALPPGWFCASWPGPAESPEKALVGPGACVFLIDLSGVDLSGVDLSGAAMSGSNLSNASLVGADLSGIKLSSGSLAGADLSGADLSDADLSDVDLTDADLTGADLTGANLTRATLMGANLGDATLARASLVDVDLSDQDLSSAELVHLRAYGLRGACPSLPPGMSCVLGATMTFSVVGPGVNLSPLPGGSQGADLNSADLSGLNLTGANLRQVIFTFADLSNAVLVDCNLRDAELIASRLVGADLSRSTLTEARLGLADLTDATLSQVRSANLKECPDALPSGWSCAAHRMGSGATLVGPDVNLSGTSVLGRPDVSGAEMPFADLSSSDFSGMNFTNADLSQANLSGSVLTGASLEGADLSMAVLTSARFSGANLTGANLAAASMYGAETYDVQGCPEQLPAAWICRTITSTGVVNLLGPGAQLSSRDLDNAWLGQVDLSEANLTNASLLNANLSNSTLSRIRLTNANLTDANLSGTELSGADLSGANLSGADLSGADLTGANLAGATGTDIDFQDATCPNGLLERDFRRCGL